MPLRAKSSPSAPVEPQQRVYDDAERPARTFRRRRLVRARFRSWRRATKIYGNIGNLEVRLARTRSDVRRIQRLRFEVFYNEMSAQPSRTALLKRRDIDIYDKDCDHLLAVDHGNTHPSFSPRTGEGRTRMRQRWRPRVVGTYRMLRQDVAEQNHGFYSQNEFDLDRLIAARGPGCRFMELGRSCVLQPYRNKRTLELLWHGLWTYIREHEISVMVGCASFEGTDPQAHAGALSFLHHTASAPDEWAVRAHDHLRVDMNMLPVDRLSQRDIVKALPPLIKGYLRLGCYVGDGAVVDHQFGTTDIFVILPVERIRARYLAHFGAPDERRSRIA